MRLNRKKFKKLKQNILKILRKIITIISIICVILIFKRAYDKKILKDPSKLRVILGDFSFLTIPIFIILKTIITFIPFIPNTLMTFSGFILWSHFIGFIINYFSYIFSAIVTFLITKKFGNKFIKKILPEKIFYKYSYVLNKSQKKFDTLFFIINCIPFAPDNIFIMLSGITNIKKKKFINMILISKFINLTLTLLLFDIVLKFFY